MQRVCIDTGFEEWRDAARNALGKGLSPEQIDFQDGLLPHTETLDLTTTDTPAAKPISTPHVSAAFLESARLAATHRDPQRWNLLYRLLCRLQGNRNLLRIETDNDVAWLRKLESQVRRDLHKMHAFVRFRKVDESVLTGSGLREQFIAWYRPDHRIVHLAAPFFAERFAVMNWTILTPDESVTWEAETRQLGFGPGVGREAAPEGDELEVLWKSYYGSIFNPARLNPRAMRSEMPVRYWSNLPETDLLPQLMGKAESRVATMVTTQLSKTSAAPFVPDEHTLPVLRAAMPACKGCELYKFATQVVPGAGATHAKLLLVGEQPGDQEDQQGVPFIGPAGKVLQRALEELGIDGKAVYMTNAVKHFKFVQRGKARLHQNPRMSEITACKPWLMAELDAIKPSVVLCLGASAAKSLLGGTFALMKERGTIKSTAFAEKVMATVHPSAVLRARDEAGREGLYRFLKDDLALAYQTAMHGQ